MSFDEGQDNFNEVQDNFNNIYSQFSINASVYSRDRRQAMSKDQKNSFLSK